MPNNNPALRAAEKIWKQPYRGNSIEQIAALISAEYAAAEAVVEWARTHEKYSSLDGTVVRLRALLAAYDKDQSHD